MSLSELCLLLVQWQVIPEVLASAVPGILMGPLGLPPRDICCSAPTGSGKTLAFVIPIVQVSALVLITFFLLSD